MSVAVTESTQRDLDELTSYNAAVTVSIAATFVASVTVGFSGSPVFAVVSGTALLVGLACAALCYFLLPALRDTRRASMHTVCLLAALAPLFGLSAGVGVSIVLTVLSLAILAGELRGFRRYTLRRMKDGSHQ